MRGPIAGLHPAAAHVLYTFEQAREELAQFCSPLTVEQLWRSPASGVASVGFHMRHIAGSVDRLTTYLRGAALTEDQLGALRLEHEAGASFAVLMEAVDGEFQKTQAVVRAVAVSSCADLRGIGRRQLPTTVGGLIVHISEHTQRHLGQAVLTSKLV